MDFKCPNIKELDRKITSDLKESLDDPRYFLGVSPLTAMSKAFAGVAYMLHAHIDHLAKYQLPPDTAKGAYLKRWARLLNIETDGRTEESIRELVLLRLEHPPRGGTKSDYVQWIKGKFPEIKNVWVYEVYMGPGTVGIAVSINNYENPMPKPEFCKDMVQPFIETVKPLGVAVTVFQPIEKKIKFEIRLADELKKPKVEEALRRLVFDYGHPEKTISRSRVEQTIAQVLQGEPFELNEPRSDVTVKKGELGVAEVKWLN